MGLPWIKLFTDLPDHPKSVRLGAILKDRRAYRLVADLLLCCGKTFPSGRFPGPDAGAAVEALVAWDGKPGAFVSALALVGFLDQDGDDLIMHGWTERNGAHADKIEKDRKKPRQHPAKPPPDVPRGDPPMSREVPANIPRGDPSEPPAETSGVDVRSKSRDLRDQKTTTLAEPSVSAAPEKLTLTHTESKPAPRVRKLSIQQAFYAWAMEERSRAYPNELPDVIWKADAINAALQVPLDKAGSVDLRKAWLRYLTGFGRGANPPGSMALFVKTWSVEVTAVRDQARVVAPSNNTRQGPVAAESTEARIREITAAEEAANRQEDVP